MIERKRVRGSHALAWTKVGRGDSRRNGLRTGRRSIESARRTRLVSRPFQKLLQT